MLTGDRIDKEKRENVKASLLTILCNATQIYRRTIKKGQKEAYRSKLRDITIRLVEKVDNNTITYEDIMGAIKELRNYCDSIGAAQKVINVYLKFYSVISNKDDRVLKELHCPIDSFVISKNHLNKIPLNRLSLTEYVEMQKILQKRYGMRILADIEAWDKIKNYHQV